MVTLGTAAPYKTVVTLCLWRLVTPSISTSHITYRVIKGTRNPITRSQYPTC